MASRSYLCGTNSETIYLSFVDEGYDSASQTISCDVYCVPLLWALFRPADIVRKTFKVGRDKIVAEAPLTRRSVAIRQLGDALPSFNQLFSEGTRRYWFRSLCRRQRAFCGHRSVP